MQNATKEKLILLVSPSTDNLVLFSLSFFYPELVERFSQAEYIFSGVVRLRVLITHNDLLNALRISNLPKL